MLADGPAQQINNRGQTNVFIKDENKNKQGLTVGSQRPHPCVQSQDKTEDRRTRLSRARVGPISGSDTTTAPVCSVTGQDGGQTNASVTGSCRTNQRERHNDRTRGLSHRTRRTRLSRLVSEIRPRRTNQREGHNRPTIRQPTNTQQPPSTCNPLASQRFRQTSPRPTHTRHFFACNAFASQSIA